MTIDTKDSYKEAFFVASEADKGKYKAIHALETAHDIRKFEIDLFWKRATYFWVLIASVFTGYFAIGVATKDANIDKDFYQFLFCCLGLIFSLSWYLANRGSKYWQENWESHVDLLEDNVTGRLYKTVVTQMPTDESSANALSPKNLLAAAPYSVSKISILISLFVTVLWLVLLIISVCPQISLGEKVDFSKWQWWALGTFTLFGVWFLLCETESKSNKDKKYSSNFRSVSL